MTLLPFTSGMSIPRILFNLVAGCCLAFAALIIGCVTFIDSTAESVPESEERLAMVAAMEAFEQDDPEAVALIETAIELNTNTEEESVLRMLQAAAALEADRPAFAEQVCKNCLEKVESGLPINPATHVQLLRSLGMSQFRQQRPSEAALSFKRAIEVAEEGSVEPYITAEVRALRGSALVMLGRPADALDSLLLARDGYEKASDTRASSLSALCYEIGNCYNQLGRFDEAIEPLTRALELAPSDNNRADALILLAIVEQSRGNLDACKGHLNVALNLEDASEKKMATVRAVSLAVLAETPATEPTESPRETDSHGEAEELTGNEKNADGNVGGPADNSSPDPLTTVSSTAKQLVQSL